MRVTSIRAENLPPIREFFAENLGPVVIVAGANGSGKSRLKDEIVSTIQKGNSPSLQIALESTRPSEAETWGSATISLGQGSNASSFQQYMQGSSRGRKYAGSVINIESDRSAAAVKFQRLTLATPDPDDVDFAHSFFMQPLASRWSHTVNSIFQKVANRDQKIAKFTKSNPTAACAEATAKFPDPFIPYQEAFSSLLPGKSLDSIDAKELREFHFRTDGTESLSFALLSSGEKEVVRIVFGLLLKDITHSVILVDEPELHLHPTLAFRMIETLRKMGGATNQYIFFTHSADLISTYYSSGNVYFIDQNRASGNQACRLSEIDANHTETAQAIGNNLGMFAVGRRLVFVEGDESSIDRMTYHRVAQRILPESSLVPIGSVENVRALARLSEELDKTVFGLEFFMLRDRDGLTDDQITVLEKNGRARCLKRRHVENYYLDPDVLAEVAKTLYLDERWHTANAVEDGLKDVACKNIKLAVLNSIKEYVTLNGTLDAPTSKDIPRKQDDEIKQELSEMLSGGLDELVNAFSKDSIDQLYDDYSTKFSDSIGNGTWNAILPGKLLFKMFCGNCLKEDATRIRQAYLDIAIESNGDTMKDIEDIFRHFASIAGV